LAKIAVELEQAIARRIASGAPGSADQRVLAQGRGWAVHDVLCTSGPQDRPFEEQHSNFSIAIVAAGTFQYRSGRSGELMTPGSLLLGNPNQYFECSHEHCDGDRCISFRYEPDYFESLAAEIGVCGAAFRFRALRVPPVRALAAVVARACSNLSQPASWEEVSYQLAAATAQLTALEIRTSTPAASAVARVTRVLRRIERSAHSALSLADLAREAGLNRYHFLRVFQMLTGLTPHQYLVRSRLRDAAVRLSGDSPGKVVDIALDCGFGDVSNFNHAFRAEFGVSPRTFSKSAVTRFRN
jgi:AraC-like DNA-binding protein